MNPALGIIEIRSATGKPRYRIHHGRHFVTVARHAKGWRFGYKVGDRWRYVTRHRFEDITHEAGRILAAKEAGLDFVALPEAAQAFLAEVHRLAPDPDTREAVLEFLKRRHPSAGC